MPSSTEEKRENGSAMLAIRWFVVLFAFLVLFFHPAAMKLGQMRFAWIAGCTASCGLLLSISGTIVRRRNG